MQEPQISEERQLDWIAKIEAILLYGKKTNWQPDWKEVEFKGYPYFKIVESDNFNFMIDTFEMLVTAKACQGGIFVEFSYGLNNINERKVVQFRVLETITLDVDQFEKALNHHFDAVTKLLTLKETSEILFID